jgi:hypothetical protein
MIKYSDVKKLVKEEMDSEDWMSSEHYKDIDKYLEKEPGVITDNSRRDEAIKLISRWSEEFDPKVVARKLAAHLFVNFPKKLWGDMRYAYREIEELLINKKFIEAFEYVDDIADQINNEIANRNYDYEDLGYGIQITNPLGENVFMQGDDANIVRNEIEELDREWQGKTSIGPFKSYEEHLNYILSQYF